MAERADFVPSHIGDHILPADPLFNRLLALAHRPKQETVIRDINTGIEKTAADLLSDVLNLRRILRSALSQSIIDDIQNGKETFISILAPGGYEFAVGILAVFALGAAASPFSPLQPVNEATYYVNKARSIAVMVATSALKLGDALASEIRKTINPSFVAVPILSYTNETPISPKDILVSSNRWVDPNSAGLIIFTSGTTGPPKAAVLRRAAIIDGALSWAQQLGLSANDTSLHLLPVHHATGIWVGFFPMIQVGACIEFRSGSFSPEWTWDRLRKGGITVFSGVPTVYMRMMRYWQETISKLPPKDREQYRWGINNVRLCICGTSALPRPIDQFWTSLRNGRRIVQRYGSTEKGVVFNMPFENNEDVPDGSVGEVTMGVDVKLSDGNEGEVLVKSPQMFSKYLHDPDATRVAHTEDGYFKSGDMARREGKYYFITGRASVDIIKSGGYKISALDIERELLSLPYIGEAMVVGVPDDEFGQRVAAVVTLRNDEMAQKFYREQNRTSDKLDIDALRADARSRLAGYKLPTLLRVRKEEIPKSPTGKVVKKTLGPQYFPPETYTSDPEVQIWRNEKSARLPKPKL
jgi:malonyl-CoA/methylmalonyl-CoA synthetase